MKQGRTQKFKNQRMETGDSMAGAYLSVRVTGQERELAAGERGLGSIERKQKLRRLPGVAVGFIGTLAETVFCAELRDTFGDLVAIGFRGVA